MKKKYFSSLFLLFVALFPAGKSIAESVCEELIKVNLEQTSVTHVESLPAGDFVAPDGFFAGQQFSLPAFCRIQGVAKPTEDSHIRFEVWLPKAGWNGRYYQVGMGGAAGSIHYPGLAWRLQQGDAVATTDTGHSGGILDWSWALNQPEKIIDFGYRAHKVTSDIARQLIHTYYQKPQDYAYFTGCSRGGHAGLVSIQRYPEEWDGVVVGDGPPDFAKAFANFAWYGQQWLKNPAGRIPVEKLPVIQRTALASCSERAHVVNGIAGDPRHCRFDPEVIACEGEEMASCLTQEQVAMLRKIYLGPSNQETQEGLFPGYPPAMEALVSEVGKQSWSSAITGTWRKGMPVNQGVPKRLILGENFYRNFVINDPDWNLQDLDETMLWRLPENKIIAGQSLASVLDADNQDWIRLQSRGTKIIMYHGWADATITPGVSIQLYESATKKVGSLEQAKTFFRLFMAPGLMHCLEGPGANAFGQLSVAIAPPLKNDAQHDIHNALEAWVENDAAPDRITAVKYIDDKPEKGVAFTRPLCSYPEVPVYQGQGSMKDADSYGCR